MSLRVAVDYDGTLVDANQRLRRGAVEAVRAIKQAGYHLTLFSVRNTLGDAKASSDFYATGRPGKAVEDAWQRFGEMRKTLVSAGIWDAFDDIWQAPGKPAVDLFIDDKVEKPDWFAVIGELGLGLKNAA